MNSHFSRRAAIFAAPLALLAISACTTAAPFRADVSRFQQLPPAQGQSFAIKAANAENDGGLEFATYAALISEKMNALGYTTTNNGNADLTVTLDYNVDEGKERRVRRRDPFYDPFWGYGSYGFGARHRYQFRPRVIRTRNGYRYIRGFYDPFLFGSGFNDMPRNFIVYTSDIEVKIKRNTDGESLFEGKAEAKSRTNKLPYLVPNLVEAMFTDFPGNNGEVVRISVAPEKKKK